MAIKTCPSCGGENHENAAVCLRCNADLSAVTPGGVPAAPPTPPPPIFPQSQQVVVAPQTNGMAIAALVLGITTLFCSFLTGIVGLVLGIIAAVQISNSGGRQKGMGMAITGIALSLILPMISAAMLFPVFAKAREKARQTQCVNNQRQLAVALQLYDQEHNGELPTGDIIVAIDVDPKAKICPDYANANGYGYNGNLRGVNLSKFVGDPKEVLCFADGNGTAFTRANEIDQKRHSGRFIGVALDGHTKLLSSLEGYTLDVRLEQ